MRNASRIEASHSGRPCSGGTGRQAHTVWPPCTRWSRQRPADAVRPSRNPREKASRPEEREEPSTLDRDRTCNLQLRRLTLYPIELRGLALTRRGGFYQHRGTGNRKPRDAARRPRVGPHDAMTPGSDASSASPGTAGDQAAFPRLQADRLSGVASGTTCGPAGKACGASIRSVRGAASLLAVVA